jgi:hypothetical protein
VLRPSSSKDCEDRLLQVSVTLYQSVRRHIPEQSNVDFVCITKTNRVMTLGCDTGRRASTIAGSVTVLSGCTWSNDNIVRELSPGKDMEGAVVV